MPFPVVGQQQAAAVRTCALKISRAESCSASRASSGVSACRMVSGLSWSPAAASNACADRTSERVVVMSHAAPSNTTTTCIS